MTEKKTCRKFDIKERLLIEKCLKLGLSVEHTSKFTGRSFGGVSKEISKNGGVKNYSAFNAQLRAEESHDRQVNALKAVHANFNNQARIESLEMQVSILHNIIKEMRQDARG